MEKITKKEFIELLLHHKSILLGAIPTSSKGLHTVIDQLALRFEPTDENEVRTVEQVRTNSIQFSNGSSIYFDGQGTKTYWKNRNVVYQYTRIDYSQDDSCNLEGVVYCAVVYYLI